MLLGSHFGHVQDVSGQQSESLSSSQTSPLGEGEGEGGGGDEGRERKGGSENHGAILKAGKVNEMTVHTRANPAAPAKANMACFFNTQQTFRTFKHHSPGPRSTHAYSRERESERQVKELP